MTKIEWTERTWNPIPNFKNYFASQDGKILSKAGNVKPHIMNPMSTKGGHKYVYLYDGKGKQKKMFVHRAVLMAWVGMPEKGQECRHLNDIPTDNRLENLCWGNRFENMADKRRNGRMPIGENSPSHRLTNEQVMDIRKRYSVGESARDLSVEFGVTHTHILAIVRGDSWKHLPLIPVVVRHLSAPKTPMSENHKEKCRENIRKAIVANRVNRVYSFVPCACGCGNTIETPDSRGRERRFLKGHNNRKI